MAKIQLKLSAYELNSNFMFDARSSSRLSQLGVGGMGGSPHQKGYMPVNVA